MEFQIDKIKRGLMKSSSSTGNSPAALTSLPAVSKTFGSRCIPFPPFPPA